MSDLLPPQADQDTLQTQQPRTTNTEAASALSPTTSSSEAVKETVTEETNAPLATTVCTKRELEQIQPHQPTHSPLDPPLNGGTIVVSHSQPADVAVADQRQDLLSTTKPASPLPPMPPNQIILSTDCQVVDPHSHNTNASTAMELDNPFSIPAVISSATFTFSRLDSQLDASNKASPAVSPIETMHSTSNISQLEAAHSSANVDQSRPPSATSSRNASSKNSSRSISGSDGDVESARANMDAKPKKHKKSKHIDVMMVANSNDHLPSDPISELEFGPMTSTFHRRKSAEPPNNGAEHQIVSSLQKTPRPSSASSSTSSTEKRKNASKKSVKELSSDPIRPKEPRFRQITNEDDIESIFRSVPIPDSDSHDEDYIEGSAKKKGGPASSSKKSSSGSHHRTSSNEKLNSSVVKSKGETSSFTSTGGAFSSPAPQPSKADKVTAPEDEPKAHMTIGTPSPAIGSTLKTSAVSSLTTPSVDSRNNIPKKESTVSSASSSSTVKESKSKSTVFQTNPQVSLKKESVQSMDLDGPPSESDAPEESSDEDTVEKQSVSKPQPQYQTEKPTPPQPAQRGRKPGVKSANSLAAKASRGEVIMIANKAIPYSAVNNTDRSGRTPLFRVSGTGDVAAVTALIRAGADVNAKDHAGWSPLHEACLEGQLETSTLLITYGADVNALGFENQTPLHDAVGSNHYDVVELLLAHGASLTARNKDGNTPEDEGKDDEAMAELLKLWKKMMERVVKVDEFGLTILHHAAGKGDLKGVKRALKYGAEVDFACFAGWTPLHEAASKGFTDIVEELCRYGADVNAPAGVGKSGTENAEGKVQSSGITPLMDAASSCHLDCVRILLEFGANPETSDSQGKRAVDHITSTTAVSDEIIGLLERPRSSWRPFRSPDFVKTKPGCIGGMMAHIRDQASAMLVKQEGGFVSTKDPK